MRVAMLIALAACNQVFELDETRIPNEGDVTCPNIGETPRFSRALTQLMVRHCDAYNYASSRALAVAGCYDGMYSVVEAGAVDGPLAPVPGIPLYAGTMTTWVSQDESRIYVSTLDAQQAYPFVIDVYRQQNGAWVVDPALQLRTTSANGRLGAIATDGERDRVVLSEGSTLTEYAVDAAWTPVRTFTATDLGVDAVAGFSMTPDGLRATFFGNFKGFGKQYYTDRPTIGDAFRRAEELDVPYYFAAYMTDDCARIYMSGVGSIFYAKQSR